MKKLITIDLKRGIDWVVLAFDTLFVGGACIFAASLAQPVVQVFMRGLGSTTTVTFWQVLWPISVVGVLLWLLFFWLYKKRIAPYE